MDNLENQGFDLDKVLADKINAKLSENEPAVEVDEVVEDQTDDGAPEVETNEPLQEEPVDKKHHAFAKLRKEKKELEKVASEQGQKLEQLVSLFDAQSVEELLEYLESEGLRIKSGGLGKNADELKKELEVSKELERLMAEKQELETKLEDQRIVKVIDDFASKYGLSAAKDFNKMIDTLDAAGLDFETLRKAKNPELLIKGATTDLVLEKVKTKKVSAIEKSRATRESEFEEPAEIAITKEQELRNSLKDYFKVK